MYSFFFSSISDTDNSGVDSPSTTNQSEFSVVLDLNNLVINSCVYVISGSQKQQEQS